MTCHIRQVSYERTIDFVPRRRRYETILRPENVFFVNSLTLGGIKAIGEKCSPLFHAHEDAAMLDLKVNGTYLHPFILSVTNTRFLVSEVEEALYSPLITSILVHAVSPRSMYQDGGRSHGQPKANCSMDQDSGRSVQSCDAQPNQETSLFFLFFILFLSVFFFILFISKGMFFLKKKKRCSITAVTHANSASPL